MDLNDIHKAQISRFAAFFKGKRERALSTLDQTRSNFVDDRMSDDAAIYNSSDAVNHVNAACMELYEKAKEDLELTVNLAAGFMVQLLSQAEQCGVSLQVDDISIIEDQNLCHQIDALSAMNAPPLAPKPRTTLNAMGAGGAGPATGTDIALLQQMEDLKEESRQLKDRNMQMQSQVTTVMQERTTLMNELEQVKATLKSHISDRHTDQSAAGANVALYQRQVAEAQQAQEQYRAEVDAARREMNQRLADSTQFRELKGIVKKKSEDIKLLRAHLMQLGYQPPCGGEDEGVELNADSD